MNSSSTCGCSAAPAAAADSAPTDSLFTAIAAEYVAIGAAVGANCEPCLRYHVTEALKVGISRADIAKAVATAAKVKEAPARNILKLAERLTQESGETMRAPGGSTEPPDCGCGA